MPEMFHQCCGEVKLSAFPLPLVSVSEERNKQKASKINDAFDQLFEFLATTKLCLKQFRFMLTMNASKTIHSLFFASKVQFFFREKAAKVQY